MAKRDEPKRTAKEGASAKRTTAKARAPRAERTAPPTPIAPYLAVGLSTVVYGVGERKHIKRNLQTIEDGIHAAMGVININMPIRIVALAEGALTGFTDEAFDIPHVTAARELFIDIPGEETEHLAGLAKAYDAYLIVQCKARWPEVMPDRFFNTLFVISPKGEVVHRAAKNHLWCRERSCTPHDVYDRWVELFGDGIDAFYPVLRTTDEMGGAVGNIGTICCSDGEYPEAVRALAFNGAEVVYRPSEAVPMTNVGYPGGGTWMLQNRAHAHFNNVYLLAPNVGPVFLHPKMKHPFDIGGGQSHIVDYMGNVVSYSPSGYNTFVTGTVDIEALRQFRVMNLNSNWMKDLRTEVFRRMYDEPIHPKNLWLDQEPLRHADVDDVYRDNIRRLISRGTFTAPAIGHAGARYFPMGDGSQTPEEEWEETKSLWADWELE
jgi:beta-ureidopropionase